MIQVPYKSQIGNPQITQWRDSSVLNAATHNMQLWVHSGTPGRSCVLACLQVPLISS